MDGLNALLLIGGGVLLYLWNTSRSAANLNYFPGNITGFSLQGLSPVITVDLIVQNTSNVDFTINSLSGNATTDNILIGNIADFTPTLVPANSQRAIPLTLTLFSLGIVDNIINALQGGSVHKTILVQGTVNANGAQVPISLQYNVGV